MEKNKNNKTTNPFIQYNFKINDVAKRNQANLFIYGASDG